LRGVYLCSQSVNNGTNFTIMTTYPTYGVEMTSLEQMAFFKFISNNNIAMNTKTADDRERLALEWLEDHLSKQVIE